ncbi:MAG: lysophospholipid acyltransferase family protein [Gemmatimonadota bacterium]
MRRTLDAVLSSFVWIAWTVLVILWTPPVLLLYLLTAWRDPARRISGRAFHSAAAVATWMNPFWRLRVSGRVPPRETHPFVVVCNHESLADPILVGSLPWEMKWLSKAANLRIPFVGWLMRLVGDEGVRRGDPESRAAAYARLREWLRRGVSVIVFPEGTRSETDELLPFRNGAFRLAIETGTPVLPLAISGTRDSIRKGSLVFRRSDISLVILDPIDVQGFGEEAVEELRELARRRIDAARRGGSAA